MSIAYAIKQPTGSVPENLGYTIVAWARGHEVLLHEESGGYQGDWLIFAVDPDGAYLLYKGYYGSCSGCDALQDQDVSTLEKAIEFASDYEPFVVIPRQTMLNIARQGAQRLHAVLPKNAMGGIDLERFAKDATLVVRLREGLDLAVSDILDAPNAELRRRALEIFGIPEFLAAMDAETIDTQGEDSLIGLTNGWRMLRLKDASTPRVYLLRVPDAMQRVRQAKAWTFNIPENEYSPLVET